MITNGASQGRVITMGTKRIGLARVQALIQNLKREIDWGNDARMKFGTNSAIGMTPEIIFKWNYTTCNAPIVSEAGLQDAAGALTAGQSIGCAFPGPNGELFPSTMTLVGAFTTTGMYPQIEGAIPQDDAGATAVGFNVQLDGETTNNCGMEWTCGSLHGSNSNKFVVGQHSGYIDATFWTSDWTDYDCVVIGFRKAEAHQSGHNAILAAGSDASNGVYTDFAAFGAMTDTDIRTMTDLNDSASSTMTDVGVVPVDSDNMRLRVSLSSTGAVTYSHVNNAEAGAGTLAEPGSVEAFSFDTGDTLIPYIATLKNVAADVELLIKDVEIKRTPGVVI
jgi:hypothetical protein